MPTYQGRQTVAYRQVDKHNDHTMLNRHYAQEDIHVGPKQNLKDTRSHGKIQKVGWKAERIR